MENGILAPTILTDVRDDMKVCSQEVFGPVVSIQTYTDLDDAIRRANDSRYGLQASIFTNDVRVAFRAAHSLDFGGVLVSWQPQQVIDSFYADPLLRDALRTRLSISCFFMCCICSGNAMLS